jgi:hypothetical protein
MSLLPWILDHYRCSSQDRARAYVVHNYLAIQGTKPSTIGVILQDSPVGLLAWIYEKVVAWSDNYPGTDDEGLTWVSIYYFSLSGLESSSYIDLVYLY